MKNLHLHLTHTSCKTESQVELTTPNMFLFTSFRKQLDAEHAIRDEPAQCGDQNVSSTHFLCMMSMTSRLFGEKLVSHIEIQASPS